MIYKYIVIIEIFSNIEVEMATGYYFPFSNIFLPKSK